MSKITNNVSPIGSGPTPFGRDALLAETHNSWASSAVIVEAGLLAPPEDQTREFESMRSYIPTSIVELVADTPADIIRRTVLDLTGNKNVSNGRTIMPLPQELEYMHRANLQSDTLYTFVTDVVRRELKQFAERLECYYHITPKELPDVEDLYREDGPGVL